MNTLQTIASIAASTVWFTLGCFIIVVIIRKWGRGL
jgi:hypothetical protein